MNERRYTPKRPVHGDLVVMERRPVMVAAALAVRGPIPWVATPEVHDALREVWYEERAWRVGQYLLMPEHLHFVAAMNDDSTTFAVWLDEWKQRFAERIDDPTLRWHDTDWHETLRSERHYLETLNHIRHNPVRRDLVTDPDDWPYQGVIFSLHWEGCSERGLNTENTESTEKAGRR